MQTTSRTLRLTAATAAALVLMTGAAQAHPLAINSGNAESSQAGTVYAGTYRPVSPAHTVTLPPDRADRIGVAPQIIRVGDLGTAEEHRVLATLGGATAAQTTSAKRTGFGWTAAAVNRAEQQRELLPAGTMVVHTTSTNGGFDWTAAAIGAASALLIALIIGGGGMTLRGRRNVVLSS
jgi:hypothetical protein